MIIISNRYNNIQRQQHIQTNNNDNNNNLDLKMAHQYLSRGPEGHQSKDTTRRPQTHRRSLFIINTEILYINAARAHVKTAPPSILHFMKHDL